METENKDWKPEVGGKAWIVWASTFQFCEIRQVVVGKEIRSLGATYFDVSSQMNGGFCETKHIDSIFPTIEKAQESFEVYDLEGKEVVIPRARSIFEGDDLHRFLRDEAGQSEDVIRGWDIPHVKQIPMRTIEEQNVMLSPDGESYLIDKQEYFDWCLRNEDTLCMFLDSKIRGGAAIGGKSDQREGGC